MHDRGRLVQKLLSDVHTYVRGSTDCYIWTTKLAGKDAERGPEV